MSAQHIVHAEESRVNPLSLNVLFLGNAKMVLCNTRYGLQNNNIIHKYK